MGAAPNHDDDRFGVPVRAEAFINRYVKIHN